MGKRMLYIMNEDSRSVESTSKPKRKYKKRTKVNKPDKLIITLKQKEKIPTKTVYAGKILLTHVISQEADDRGLKKIPFVFQKADLPEEFYLGLGFGVSFQIPIVMDEKFLSQAYCGFCLKLREPIEIFRNQFVAKNPEGQIWIYESSGNFEIPKELLFA